METSLRSENVQQTQIIKKELVEAAPNEDISNLPCLEMRIHHSGKIHEPQNESDKVIYKYKSPMGKEVITLDEGKMDEFSENEKDEEEITYEDQDKTVSVKKSIIDNYRKKSEYYGPLRIISEKVKVKEKGVLREAVQAKLQHVEIQATDNEGHPVNEHELKILMSQTPGIIPASDPSMESTKEGYFYLNLGEEKYKVLKKAMSAFQNLASVKPPFNTKIQKVFTNIKGSLMPITIVILYPRVDKVVYQPTLLDEKKQPIKKTIPKKGKNNGKLVNYYRHNYINWAHRGNVCFSQIKKIGIDFVDEILIENPTVLDSLKQLGCSLSASANNLEPLETAPDNTGESANPVGSREFVEEIWAYLTGLVRCDSYLIEFEFEMDEEKWLEVKRAFNMFQVDGEVIPDIVLKVVCKKKGDVYELTYYLRCIERLIKSGPVTSKVDINDMLKCLSKDKYICVGLSKEPFIRQVDTNEMLRLHMKENCYLSTRPFESVHDRKCKAIVRDIDTFENSKIQRGPITVYAPFVLCQSCDALQKKLKELLDISQNSFVPQEVAQRFLKQRYGPIHAVSIEKNIKNLFVQTPSEFVSRAKRKLSSRQVAESQDDILRQLKTMEEDSDISKSEKPSIEVTEEEFDKMVSFKKRSKANARAVSVRKKCQVCDFEARTMLSLFTHMNDHLGPLNEQCQVCKLKVSDKNALFNHKALCVHSKKTFNCPECHNIFSSEEKLFEHINIHRVIKPFVCNTCNIRMQTMNEYKKHIKLIHQINTVKQLNFVCSVCHSYFYTGDHLLIHKLNQNHVDKEHFRCKICTFSCNLVSAFHTHILSHSYDEREKTNLAMCPECKKIFFSSFRMEDHIKRKHGEILSGKENAVVEPSIEEVQAASSHTASFEGFTCSTCYKVYSTINALQKHVEIQHAEKPQSSSVTLHIVACNVCGRKFNSEHTLGAHMKLHLGNRQVFQCEECGYVYGKRSQVLEHIRNDHAEQVEKHQQMQQHGMIIDTPLYQTQSQAQQHHYAEPPVIAMEAQNQIVQQPQSTDSWAQIKIPNAEQNQEVNYNFSNFNPQFF